MQREKFGIYLNVKKLKVVRINSPFWIPSGNEWVIVTPDVNATILNIRDLAQQNNLVDQPDKITWGSLPELMK